MFSITDTDIDHYIRVLLDNEKQTFFERLYLSSFSIFHRKI